MTTGQPAQWLILERYRVLGEVGRGAMGIVYKVHDDRPMEFVDGERLGERIRGTPSMPVGEAARIATSICEALEYAHVHGVIHRSGTATHTGPPRGTPRYMAPEQWRGDPVDGRADVYAVGIILYAMLTGCPAFPTKSPSELRDRVLHEEPVPPTLVNPELPAAIDPIVRRAIAREPADRYATAGELARALAPFVTEAVATPHDALAEAVTVVGPKPEQAEADR